MTTQPEQLADGVTLYSGDCLGVLRALPDASFDAVITDPPYSSGGAFRGDRMGGTVDKYVRGNTQSSGAYLPFAGDNRDQRAYGYWCALWLAECLRVTAPGGVCCLFTDWRQLPTTTDALQAGGWVWRGIAVWDKTESARPAKGRFRNQCEYVVWGSNGSMGSEVSAENTRECLPGVFRQSTAGNPKRHIAGKPVPVMRRIVQICPPGGTVLDPFAGSGTTGVAAALEGRRAILIEREPAYCEVIRKRVAESAGLFAENPA